MPQGLQVWSVNGNLTVSITDRITRITNSGVTVSNTAGFVDIPTSGSDKVWFSVLVAYDLSSDTYANINLPVFTLTGSRLSWSAAQRSVSYLAGIY